MTVQELIQELQKHNPDMEVRIMGVDLTDWITQNEIGDVFIGESNWEEDMKEIKDEDGDIDYTFKQILLIDAGTF